MPHQDRPRVKLPNHISRKPVVPGPNSWAQSQQQQPSSNDQIDNFKVTNRDKYEKPMPPPPPEEVSPPRTILQQKTYIQPAIPLIKQIPKMTYPKSRAVTDPVAPKPLFASRKASVTQLRKKFSSSKVNIESLEDDTIDASDLPATVRLSSEEAAQVLDLYPVQNNKRITPLTSAPNPSIPDPFRILYEDTDEQTDTGARQVQSTPVPTRRYLTENGLPTPTLVEPSDAAQHHTIKSVSNDHDQSISTDSLLRPSRVGTFGNLGDVGRVQENGMHRYESFRGVIETVSPTKSYDDHHDTASIENPVHMTTDRGQNTGPSLASSVYTPGNYGGVWENDPAVGFSLPPFSPMTNGLPCKGEISGGDPPQQPSNTKSRENFGSFPSTRPASIYGPGQNFRNNQLSEYQHPFPSANSWASESQCNSFPSTNPPLSALLPPRWPHNHFNNSVPSPPQNQDDFQRSGSISAALTQIEMTLHHHIDSSSGSLSRLITDKHDRAMDQMLRRLENLEDTVSKVFRNLKSEVKDIKKDVGNLQGDLTTVVEGNKKIAGLIEGLNGKIQTLDSHVEEHACKCQLSATDNSTSETDSDRQRREKSHRRAESAQGRLSYSEQRKQHQRGVSRHTNGARESATSSRGRRSRSNTLSGQHASRMSDERRREYFAELGAIKGPVPDLREHPAYVGLQQGHACGYGQDQNGMVNNSQSANPSPSLSDGRWYQQAYGQSR